MAGGEGAVMTDAGRPVMNREAGLRDGLQSVTAILPP